MDTHESNPAEGLGREGQVDQVASLLAGEMETTKPEPKKPVKQEPAAQEENETEAEQIDDEEGEETPPDESTESDTEVNEEEVTWSTTLGLSDDQISFDEDGNFKGVNIKVNGVTSTVPLGELVKGYQTGKAVTQKATALAEERKQFETARTQVTEEFTTRLSQVDMMAKFLGEQLTREFNGVNWEGLRATDPAEYAALRQDYAARAQQIQQAQNAIAEEMQTAQKEARTKQLENHNAYVAGQRVKMLENNPTWNDPDKFKADMTEIKSFLGNQYGFQDQDFQYVTDARLIELIKDAKKYHAGKTAMTKQLTKPVPKFQKSAGKPVQVSKLAKLTKAAKSATGANKRHLQSEAVAHLLLGEK